MPTVSLENDQLRAVFVPERGGRMISLVRTATGSEFLATGDLENPTAPKYGQKYEDYDPSGFDECLPTVEPCSYLLPGGAAVSLPDHGELWTARWDSSRQGEAVVLTAHGDRLPYLFRKRAALKGSELILDYEIANEGERGFHFLWSAHPLLRVERGSSLFLPPECRELYVNWSREDRLGEREAVCTWPVARQRDGESDDLRVVKSIEAGTADKLFTRRLRNGFCALHHPSSNESVVFRFDPALVPYVGVWICYGGWPVDGTYTSYAVALEPCNGWPDSLARAAEQGDCAFLASGETKRWSLRVELRAGPPPVPSQSQRG